MARGSWRAAASIRSSRRPLLLSSDSAAEDSAALSAAGGTAEQANNAANHLSLPGPTGSSKVESVGLTYHSPEAMADRRTYWDESACYEFTAAEVDTLEAAANSMQEMCLAAAQHVIDNKRYAELEIPPKRRPGDRVGMERRAARALRPLRLQLGRGQQESPKLLEYNADTPTSLLEAAVVQWHWLEESLHASVGAPLLSVYRSQGRPVQLHPRTADRQVEGHCSLPRKPVYFAGTDEPEDLLTLAYLEDTAQQAGLDTPQIAMLDIGWNEDQSAFLDLEREIASTPSSSSTPGRR